MLGLGVKCTHTLDMLRFHILRSIAKMTYSPILIGGGNRVIYVLGLGVKCTHTLDMLRFHILRLMAKMTYSPILIGGDNRIVSILISISVLYL